jgi:hypothetical protein
MKTYQNYAICLLGWCLLIGAGVFAQADDLAKLEAKMIEAGRVAQVDDLAKIEKQIKQSKNPDFIALSLAADYDIFKTDVLVQTIYSQKLEETILFLPVVETSEKESKKIPNWEIRVIFPNIEDSERHPIIKTRNVRKLNILESEKKKLGKVVILASWYMTEGRGLGSPLVIHAGKRKRGILRYYMGFTYLPATPGAHTSIRLSDDLKNYKIMPGM